jgi:fused signal recognition particle receptor
MGFMEKFGLSKLKETLSRTRESLVGKITRLASTRATIDDDVLGELEEILISADVGIDASGAIVSAIRRRAKEERYADAGELKTLLKDEIRKYLITEESGDGTPASDEARHRPFVIMIVGVNGVGKTTTIGKLAHAYRTAGRSVMMAAADTFRAAANEQLSVWAERAGADIIKQEHGADAAAVAFDAVNAAKARGTEVLIVDTAGRLHTRVNLMEELRKVRRVIQKADPSAPHEVLLVLDATTGQNGLQQARQFSSTVGVTGLVLTKLDGTAKGGIVFAISSELRIPVRYIGVGESLEDLQPFDPVAFVEALFAS